MKQSPIAGPGAPETVQKARFASPLDGHAASGVLYLASAAFGFAGAAFLHLRRLRRGQDAGSVAL